MSLGKITTDVVSVSSNTTKTLALPSNEVWTFDVIVTTRDSIRIRVTDGTTNAFAAYAVGKPNTDNSLASLTVDGSKNDVLFENIANTDETVYYSATRVA